MVEPIDIRTGKPFQSRRCHEHHPPSDGASLGGGVGRARGLLGGCFTGCLMAQQSAPTPPSNPYVTDGLRCWYDAIMSAARGDGKFTNEVNGFALTGAATFANNGLFLNSSSVVFSGTDTDAYDNWSAGTLYPGGLDRTVEWCVTIPRSIGGWWQNNALMSSYEFAIYTNGTRMFVKTSGSGFDRNIIDGYPYQFTTSNRTTSNYSGIAGNGVYLNGGDTPMSAQAGSANISSTMSINKGPTYGLYIHSIRVYDRCLSVPEMQSNYAADVARFGLT